MITKEKTLHILILSTAKILKNPFGGEDMFSRLLGKWLARLHQEVTLMGIEYGGVRVKTITYDSAKSEIIPKMKESHNQNRKFKYGYLFYSLRSVYWISQVLRILSIDMMSPISLIHAQDSGYTGLAAVIAGKILHVPVVITLHGIRYEQIESNPYVNKILKWIELKIEHRLDAYTLTNAAVVTIVSPTLKSYVNRIAPKSAIVSIPVAVKSKQFEFSESKRELLRNELGIEKDSRVLGYVGRLSYEKNLKMLLDSFADAIKEDSSLKLVLIGEGPLESELRNRTRDMQIEDKVIFCGFRQDIGEILSIFDIFVLPSIIEGTSNALVEAMTCGRAIICSKISGNCELVTNNKDALIINPNDRQGFKDAILLLSSDAVLRSKLGLNAKINARQYDEDIVFPKFLEYYKSLCKKISS